MTTGHQLSPFGAVDSGLIGYGDYYKRDWAGGDTSSGESYRMDHSYSVLGTSEHRPLVNWGYTFAGTTPGTASSGKFSAPVFSQPPNVATKMLNKLYSAVKGSDFNVAITTYEANKTLDMIADTVKNLMKAKKLSDRKDYAGALRVLIGYTGRRSPLGAAANTRLGLQYGWLQAYRDIQEATKLYTSIMANPKLPRVKVSTVVNSKKGDQTWTTHRWKTSHSKYVIEYRYSPKAMLPASALLGLHDPLPVLYELVPYSFVADWVIAIGPWIEAHAASRVLTGDISSTVFWKTEWSGLQTGLLYLIKKGESAKGSTWQVQRSTGFALPSSMPQFNPIAKSASLDHVITGLALLSSTR